MLSMATEISLAALFWSSQLAPPRSRADDVDLWRACLEPKEIGPGRAAMPRWYFDVHSATCKNFTWGGVQPNGNNFETEEACTSICMSVGACCLLLMLLCYCCCLLLLLLLLLHQHVLCQRLGTATTSAINSR